MGLNRRRVVQLGTAATVGTLFPRVGAAATDQNETFEQEFANTLNQLRTAFTELGFSEAEPLSLASGVDDYNGGLRHDFDQSVLPSGEYVIQPLARVADVDEKSRADVLPLFHEVGCHPADADGQTTTQLMMQILTQSFGLDPSRIDPGPYM